MTTKESKAQTEVWEWKEKASADFLKVPEGQRLQYIADRTDAIIARLKIRKATLKPIVR